MLSIKVGDPKKEGTGFSAKTTYLITTTVPVQCLSTKNGLELQTFTIRRRYSEFLKVYTKWKLLNPLLPPLPPKTTLKRFADDTVQKRMDAFNTILKKSLQLPKLRESKDFQEFLGIQHDLMPDGQENEPWYYGPDYLEGCTTDQDLDRICQNYRKNKPDLADVLEGMGKLSLKCRHLGQLMKLMDDRTEEERKQLVQWAALRLEDLNNNPNSKDTILKYVKFYSEKQCIEIILNRAIEIQESQSLESNQGVACDEEFQETSLNIGSESNEETEAVHTNSDQNPKTSSLQNGILNLSTISSQPPRRPPPAVPINSDYTEILDIHKSSSPKSIPRESVTSNHISTPTNTIQSSSEFGNNSITEKTSYGNSETIPNSFTGLTPPTRPNTPPPFRNSVNSEFSQFLNSQKDDQSKSSPLAKTPISNNTMPQVQFVQMFTSLQKETNFESKLEYLKQSLKSSSRIKCQQLQYLLGSFASDDERMQILQLVKVSDPDNLFEIKGYSEEFTNAVHEYIRNQSIEN